MVLNWYLESYRWKISVHSFEKISLKDAAKDVLSGLAMNWVMPFTSGDVISRLADKRNKRFAAIAIALNRGIMLFLTCAFGLFGITTFYAGKSTNFHFILFSICIFLIVCLLFTRTYFLKKDQFTLLRTVTLIKVIGISLLRYLIFTAQFFIILKLFLPDLDSYMLLSGLGWVFFFKSMIPSLFGGLGLREASAMVFFEQLVPNISLVLFPVFILWVINTVLPSIFGTLLIWKLKLKIAG